MYQGKHARVMKTEADLGMERYHSGDNYLLGAEFEDHL